jgi:hypothetical protein
MKLYNALYHSFDGSTGGGGAGAARGGAGGARPPPAEDLTSPALGPAADTAAGASEKAAGAVGLVAPGKARAAGADLPRDWEVGRVYQPISSGVEAHCHSLPMPMPWRFSPVSASVLA